MRPAYVLVVLFYCAQLFAQQPAAQGKNANPTLAPGRYQLFQGEYTFININGQEFRLKELFKLDTATGELFVCARIQFDGKLRNQPGKMIQHTECSPFEKDEVIGLPKDWAHQ